MTKQPIHGLTNAQLVERARELLPRGHGVARRIHRQVMMEGRFDPEGFGLGPEASEAWRSEFSFDLPEVVAVQSDEGHHGATSKMVLRLRRRARSGVGVHPDGAGPIHLVRLEPGRMQDGLRVLRDGSHGAASTPQYRRDHRPVAGRTAPIWLGHSQHRLHGNGRGARQRENT